MTIAFEFHPDLIALLPILALGTVECERCGGHAGWCLQLGWLCWTLAILFATEDTCP